MRDGNAMQGGEAAASRRFSMPGCACGARHPCAAPPAFLAHLRASWGHRTDRRAARSCVLRSAALDRA